MKKRIFLFLIILFFPAILWAQTIILESGKEVNGKILERTDDFIRIDVHDVAITYYRDEIISVSDEESPPLQEEQIVPAVSDRVLFEPEETTEPVEALPPIKAFEILEEIEREEASSFETVDEVEPSGSPDRRSSRREAGGLKESPFADTEKVLNVFQKFKTIAPGLALFLVIFMGMMFVATWQVYSKAGYPGWVFLVPIYNAYVFVKLAGKPGWWMLLFFVPYVNIIIAIILNINVAQNFGKGIGFGFGLMFCPYICYPILAFGDAQYQLQERPVI